MKKNRRLFLKQKPILYFDENFPLSVLAHFRKRARWKKKIKILSANELDNKGQSDSFQFAYCMRNNYTLVTFDEDFADDIFLLQMEKCLA
jgi:predicted nuclease of predicted toxin-antitoxin system